MGNVHQVAGHLLHHPVAFEVALDCGIWLQERDNLEIGRQRADFGSFGRGTNQKKLIVLVNSGEGSNDISSVGAHPELGDPPDINGDLHGMI